MLTRRVTRRLDAMVRIKWTTPAVLNGPLAAPTVPHVEASASAPTAAAPTAAAPTTAAVAAPASLPQRKGKGNRLGALLAFENTAGACFTACGNSVPSTEGSRSPARKRPRLPSKRWTGEEEDSLSRLVQVHGEDAWEAIAQHMPGERSAGAIEQHYHVMLGVHPSCRQPGRGLQEMAPTREAQHHTLLSPQSARAAFLAALPAVTERAHVLLTFGEAFPNKTACQFADAECLVTGTDLLLAAAAFICALSFFCA